MQELKPSSLFFDAFISYGRADSKAFAAKLYSRLKDVGYRIWFDQEDIPLAVDFQEQINNGIEKTHNFLFIIAPHSVNSPYCLKEIELAIALNKRIIPLLHVEQTDRDLWQERYPNGSDQEWETYQAEGRHTSFQNIHPVIGKINWIYFREDLDDFETALAGLIHSINKHDDYVQQHTKYLDLALEWSRNQRRSHYLLLEERRRQAESWLKRRFTEEQPPCIPTPLHGEFICASTRQAEGDATKVCLSYVSSLIDPTDDIISYIRQSLMGLGITLSDNKSDSQTSKVFDARRRRKIDYADNFIYFITEESFNNDYCQEQFQYAFEQNKRIIFLIIQPVKNGGDFSLLEEISLIDFTEADQPRKRQASMDALLNLLDRDDYYHESHKRLLVRALRWWEQRQKPSLLLRGHSLQIYQDLAHVAEGRKNHQFTHIQKGFLKASIEGKSSNVQIDVFLIYSPTDIDFTTKINEALEYQGKTTFFAKEHLDSKHELLEQTEKVLTNAANVVFVMSPSSAKSPDCLAQLERAKTLKKRAFGVLYRAMSPENIEAICPDHEQWLDFSDLTSDFYAELSQLLGLLDTDKAHVQSHTKWLQRTTEWQDKKKTRDLLLRGSELAIAQYWLKEAEEENKRPEPTAQQREFIKSSVVESQKNIRRQKILFAAVSVGFVISTISGFVATRKSYEAEVSELNAIVNTSSVLFSSNNELDAFVEAMQAWQKSKNIHLNPGDRSLLQRVSLVLSQSVYQLREANRLSKHEAAVYAIDYNSSGDLLVSGSADKRINVWSDSGELLQTLGEVGPINQGHTASVFAVQFSPDDQLIASASADHSIKLWQLDQSGEYQFQKTLHGCVLNAASCNGHAGGVNAIAFSPDGQIIASASEDQTIKLWQRDGQYLTTLGEADPSSQHKKAVNDITFSTDGRRLISVSDDLSIKIWERPSLGEPFVLRQTIAGCAADQTCDGHQNEIKGVAITLNGDKVVTASDDKTVKIWQVEDGTLLHTLIGHTDEVEGVAIETNVEGGDFIASVSRDKTIRLWSIEGTAIRTLSGHQGRIYDVVFKPNEAAIATSSRDRSIKLWRLDNDIVTPFYGHTSRVYAATFSPDGQIIASTGRDQTIKLWDRQGQLLYNLTGHQAEIEKVVFSPDGRLLASASWDGTVKLWTVRGELLNTFEGHTKEVYGVDFSPDSTMVASLSADQTLQIWDLNGKVIQRLALNENRVYDVQFSNDGALIAIAADNIIQTFERKDSEGLGTYRIGKKIGSCQILDQNCNAHADDIEAIAISRDNSMIISASRDSTVKFWDRAGNNLLTLRGHDGEIEGVAISEDDSKLVSASRDSTLIVWENLPTFNELSRLALRSDQPLEYWAATAKGRTNGDRQQNKTLKSTILKGHRAEVYDANFNSDGTMLVSASADKTIILWDLEVALNLDALIDYGCNWAKDYLKYSDEVENTNANNKELCPDQPQATPIDSAASSTP